MTEPLTEETGKKIVALLERIVAIQEEQLWAANRAAGQGQVGQNTFLVKPTVTVYPAHGGGFQGQDAHGGRHYVTGTPWGAASKARPQER